VVQFDNKVSTGHLLTAGAMIVAGVMGYADLRASNSNVAEKLAAAKIDIASQEARLRALELGATRTDEKLSNILAVLARIERQLEAPKP
jgi:hypothetical protein